MYIIAILNLYRWGRSKSSSWQQQQKVPQGLVHPSSPPWVLYGRARTMLAPVSGGLALGTLQQAEGGVGRGGSHGETAAAVSHDWPVFISAYKVFAHGICALLWILSQSRSLVLPLHYYWNLWSSLLFIITIIVYINPRITSHGIVSVTVLFLPFDLSFSPMKSITWVVLLFFGIIQMGYWLF